MAIICLYYNAYLQYFFNTVNILVLHIMPVKVFLYKTPGLSVASSGERITREIDFYKKVGEVEHCIVCLLKYKNCLLSFGQI